MEVWQKVTIGALTAAVVALGGFSMGYSRGRAGVLITVGGRSVEEMTVDEAVGRIKGRSGLKVALGVIRDGVLLGFEIRRRSIELPNLVARVTKGELGYIRLLGFA